MSSYDSGPSSRIARASGTSNPRQAIETLRTPGIVAPGPDYSNAAQFAQLTQALQGVGEVAGQIHQIDRQNEADIRRAEADQRQAEEDARRVANEQRRIDNEAAMHDRGLANLHADKIVATDVNLIRTGKMFTEPGDAAAQVEQYIGTLGEGHSEAYQTELRQQLQRPLTQELIARRENLKSAARADNNVLLAAGARSTEDPSVIADYEKSFVKSNPDATELDAKVAIVLPALKNAAEANSPARLDAAIARLDPKVFETPIREAKLKLQEVQKKAEALVADNFSNQISALRNSGAPAEMVNKTITDANVPDHLKEQQFMHTKTWDAERRRNVQFQESQQRIDAVQADYRNEAVALASSNELFKLQDKEVVIPDGTPDGHKVELKAKDVKQMVLQEQFANIASQIKDPAAALNLQLHFASEQGVVYDGWKQTYNAGFAATSKAAYYAANDKEPPALPKQAGDALDLYRAMKNYPGLLNQIGMDQQGMQTLERAYTMQRFDSTYANDNNKAMAESVRRSNDPVHISLTAAEKKKFDTNTNKLKDIPWEWRDAMNGSEIKQDMQDIAYAKIEGGMPADIAIKSTFEDMQKSRVFIGAHSINLMGMDVPPNKIKDLEKAAAGFISEYASEFKDAGINPKNLTLKPDRTDGLWIIRDAINNVPVPTTIGKKSVPSMKVVISTQELLNRMNDGPSLARDQILQEWEKGRMTNNEVKAMILGVHRGY